MDINIKRLRLLRHLKEWTQADVAEMLKMSVKIETGLTDVNLSRRDQLAKIHELSASKLFHFLADQDNPEMANSIQLLNNKILVLKEENEQLLKKLIAVHQELHRT